MATKKQEVLSEEQTPMEEAAPQTEMNPELEEMDREEMHDAIAAESPPPQTEREMTETVENSADLNAKADDEGALSQTETEEPKRPADVRRPRKNRLSLTQKHILIIRMLATASRRRLSPGKGGLLPDPSRWCPLMSGRPSRLKQTRRKMTFSTYLSHRKQAVS